MHDILIRGGILFDGAGNPGVVGDLAIAGGRIAAIGPSIADAARKIIDAGGLAVAPGFIDIKTHSDFTLPINPKAESKVRQGVTTEIIGHCGFSVAPVLPGKVELLEDYLSPSAPWLPFRETSFPGLSADLPGDRGECRHAGRPQHAAPDGDGHGRPRAERGRARAHDRAPRRRARCRRARHVLGPVHAARLLCRGGRDDRARPRSQAPQRRLFHALRDESNKVIEAVEEAIEIGEQCGVHVEIVHFKCSGTDNWGKAAQALAMIADAKARGLDVDCDAYPYAAGSTR